MHLFLLLVLAVFLAWLHQKIGWVGLSLVGGALLLGLIWLAFYLEAGTKKLQEEFDSALKGVLHDEIERLSVAYRSLVTTSSFGLLKTNKFEKEAVEFFQLQLAIRLSGKPLNVYSSGWTKRINYFVSTEAVFFVERYLSDLESPDFRKDMSGKEYEEMCADILRGRGFLVNMTPVSGDHGVDIVASYGGRRLAIQCKRYSGKASNSAVQEVVAGMRMYNCLEGAVVAPNGFTDAAQALARAHGVRLVHHSDLQKL